MKKWGIGLWSVLLLILTIVIFVMYEILYLYYKANVLKYYFSLLVAEIVFYTAVTILL